MGFFEEISAPEKAKKKNKRFIQVKNILFASIWNSFLWNKEN